MPEAVEEKWIFKLNIPSTANDAEKNSIVTTQAATFGQHTKTSASSSSPSPDADGESDTSNTAREKKSLLQNQDLSESQCCWQYTGPRGMNLASNTLLKLSYRPAWQGIPEYTNSSRLTSCCRCRSNSEMEEEQVWEIYTQEQVVKTEKREIAIRGMGKCQAIQVFLKPLFDHDNDDASQERMSPPRELQSSLTLHRERMGQQQRSDQEEQKEAWSRFTEVSDSSPNHTNHIVVTFAVPLTNEDSTCDPPLLWKVDLPRFQSTDVCLDTMTIFEGTVDLSEDPTHVYIQGYQSWSFTGSILKGKKQPQPALPDMFSKAFNFGGTPCERPTLVFPETNMSKLPSVHELQDKRMYQSDYFVGITTSQGSILDESGGPAFVCGWLSQHEQLGVVNIDPSLTQLEMHATHRAHLVAPITTTDWAYVQLVTPHHYDEEPLVHYLQAAAAFNEARPLQNGPILTGWCSWYHYYENISEENLRENFAKLASLQDNVPTNVAVVDDGYMTAWGDWDSFKPKKFTDMTIVSQDIERNGMRPGLWLAPFACDKHSVIAKQNPEWIIRNDKGRPANSSNCGKFFYGLDATNPHVRAYVAKCIRRAVKDWGFQVLKIDFLYAACLEGNGKYDLSMTRAQAMHLALQTIREAAGPNVFLIGCGCPVGVGIGYVDGMRVSADTGPTWYPAFPLPWWDHGTLPSLRAMIRNSMTRASYGHRWWHNDPDCLLLGKTTSLTNDEVATACSVVGMTCGMMLLSDDLTKVPADRLQMVTKIFPMTGATAVVLDLHSATDQGLPSIMRLWCTDKFDSLEEYRKSSAYQKSIEDTDHNAEATHFGRKASFDFQEPKSHPNDRKRSCIHVAKGLGTWTTISLTNVADEQTVMHIPPSAVHPLPSDEAASSKHGCHVFSFWSGNYSWASSSADPSKSSNKAIGPLSHKLGKHESEIFHIKSVTPGVPQYIGSDMHFSCGYEVLSFDTSQSNKLVVKLKTELKREGHVVLFLPVVDTTNVKAFAGSLQAPWSIAGSTPGEEGVECIGRIIKVAVTINADGTEEDGEVIIEY
mmetsp:Transcript_29512/g.70928  ORF Transcript_29512/g.70928 Transcript_29512/m.70928 type:complete len:1047 (+) Transcript_29512:65-3205(+)